MAERISDYSLGSPAHLALTVLAHKWTLLIVLALRSGPVRFTHLRRLVPGVTAQVLSESLRHLERDGVVARRDFSEMPPHVEYRLTDLGFSLSAPARAIRAWGDEHGEDVLEARQRYDHRADDHRADDHRAGEQFG
jgi:DNA-binding HxlR family transcriptional regulator